jgi:AraC-like DNA-binding protein
MRPALEKIVRREGESWAMLNRRLDGEIPFQWHHHPEFELTMTMNSRGERFIGDHIGSYGDGDLVLVGPNLPHTWRSSDKLCSERPHVALVMWFSPQWAATLAEGFAELSHIAGMLTRADGGLGFSLAYAQRVRPMIEDLFTRPPDERLLRLVEVLSVLARDDASETLASRMAITRPAEGDRTRIDRVLDHIHLNYASGVTIAELADIAALSPSGLHRLFRRHVQLTISDYLIRMKIGEACAMLTATAKPIAHIAEAVGYNSLANFNRQFKALKGLTPLRYRQRFPSPRR